MITLYNVISLDGFIAREDGSEDFIPDEVWQDFINLCDNYDAVVFGRKTYKAIQKYDLTLLNLFENHSIKKIVISRDPDFFPKAGYEKKSSPGEVASLDLNILLTSGPSLNTVFLKEGLIDKIILNKLSNSIGKGLTQFEEGSKSSLIPEYYLNSEI